MGAFLDKPKTEKTTKDEDGNGIRYGVSAMQGWQKEMEDANICALKTGFGENFSFFGVFDGHNGPKIAQECSTNLLDSIQESYKNDLISISLPSGREKIKNSIHDGFINFDKNSKKLNGADYSDGGTTAIVCFVTPEHIIWGNCGDSRGIFCSEDKVKFVTTSDHKPYNEIEKRRIEKAGGTVTIQRVNGTLTNSRSLGDFDYKRCRDLPSTEQLVSPEPEITVMDRDMGKDQFLILACDGIFNVMSNEEVIKHVLHQLQLKDKLSDICNSLIDKCLDKGSRDNMSVIIVTFPGAPVVSEEAIEEEKKRKAELTVIITEEITSLVKGATDSIDYNLNLDAVMSHLRYTVSLGRIPIYDDVISQREIQIILNSTKQKFGIDDFSNPADDSSNPADDGRDEHQ